MTHNSTDCSTVCSSLFYCIYKKNCLHFSFSASSLFFCIYCIKKTVYTSLFLLPLSFSGRGDENPFCKDNVHLNQFGLGIVANKIIFGVEKICAKNVASAALTNAGTETYYWRGFGSSRGAARTTRTAVASGWRGRGARGHGGHHRGRGFHPYHRGGGRHGWK